MQMSNAGMRMAMMAASMAMASEMARGNHARADEVRGREIDGVHVDEYDESWETLMQQAEERRERKRQAEAEAKRLAGIMPVREAYPSRQAYRAAMRTWEKRQ